MTRTAARSVPAVLAFLAVTPALLAQSKVDTLGDPLPDGAIARVGTTRMRHFSLPDKLCFGIGCIAWSPDGKMIATTMFASGRVGVQARLWEASTGKALSSLENNENYGPSFVRFSPDSKTLAAAGGSKVVLWDAATGKELGRFGHTAEVDTLAFQDGGKTIVSVSGDGAVHRWDVASRKEIRTWQTLAKEPKANEKGEPFETQIYNSCFSNDGKSLAFEKWWTAGKGFRRSGSTMAMVFDVDARKELWREDTGGYGCAFAFAPDGKRLAMAGKGCQFFLFDVATGRQLSKGPATGLMPFGLAFAPDGKSVAIHWFAGLVFWSLDDKKAPLREIKSDSEIRLDGGTTPTFSPDGKLLAVSTSVSTHMSFRVLDAASGKPAVYWPSNDFLSWGDQLRFAADGRILHFGRKGIDTGTWTVKWEAEDPERRKKFNLNAKLANGQDAGKILDLWFPDPDFRAANSDYSLCVAKNGEHANSLLDLKTGKVLAKLDRPDPGLERCSGLFSPRSTLYVVRDWDSVYKDGKVREVNTIFAIPAGKRLCRLPTEYGTSDWTFSADESRVGFFENHTGTIHVYETATGKLTGKLGETDSNWKWIYAALALSPDGKKLAVWREDLKGKVQIWDVQAGKHHWLALEKIEKGHVAACLAWSPDSRMLAVGGLDNSVRLWEVASAQVRREFVGHLAQARVLAFSPDGEFLVSGSEDTTLLVWQTPSDKKPRN
jgi:WD40 repeat protein